MLVRFRQRYLLAPYLDHVERSGEFRCRLFACGDKADVPMDIALMLMAHGVAEGENPLADVFILRAGTPVEPYPEMPWR